MFDFPLDGVCILGTGRRIGNLLTTGVTTKDLLTASVNVAVPVVFVWSVALVRVSEAVPVSSVCCVGLSNLTVPVFGSIRGLPNLDMLKAEGLVSDGSLVTGFVLTVGLLAGPDEESPDDELLDEPF